jgi:hypothetical protein
LPSLWLSQLVITKVIQRKSLSKAYQSAGS